MLPAEHKGHTETRNWYKIKWRSNPHPELQAWNGIEGKTDLMMDEDYECYKDSVDVVEVVRADTCATGLVLSFGRVTEQQVDEWIARNRK